MSFQKGQSCPFGVAGQVAEKRALIRLVPGLFPVLFSECEVHAVASTVLYNS